jgi:thioredoxin-like negative regulator of GroEL
VDIDENREMATKYKISSVPTIVFEVDGKEVHRLSGVLREEGFKQILDKLLQK